MFNPKEYPPIERNADGSLIRMTQQQHWEAKRLIRRFCCNCKNDNCLLLDQGEEFVCPQLLSRSVCCMYFRHVLLNEPEASALKAAVFGGEKSRRCALCGKTFIAHGNRAKYCDDCKVVAKKKQQAEYAKRVRAKSRKIEF